MGGDESAPVAKETKDTQDACDRIMEALDRCAQHPDEPSALQNAILLDMTPDAFFRHTLRKVRFRPGKGNSNSHGARPVHLTITMIKWIRTNRLTIKNSPSIRFRAKRVQLRRFQGRLPASQSQNVALTVCGFYG